MYLTDKDIRELAKLMKLNLSDKEVEKFRDEMSSILSFIGKLKEVDISKAEEVGQVSGIVNNWRKDKLGKSMSDPETILKEAPEREDDLIKVPGVFNE
jgi:aspartyl-tRNA(Asn)/glutamyl-tRNA(Gln) amidotransferase subunit C